MNPEDKDYGKFRFEQMWSRDNVHTKSDVIQFWQDLNVIFDEDAARKRSDQLVYVVKNEKGEVVGESSAFKVPIRQLRNWFYAIRLLIVPGPDTPAGLLPKLVHDTRDFLESMHGKDKNDPCIGIITLVENERLKKSHTRAVWPASGMVYIGNSPKGHQIRVYYFKGAMYRKPALRGEPLG